MKKNLHLKKKDTKGTKKKGTAAAVPLTKNQNYLLH